MHNLKKVCKSFLHPETALQQRDECCNDQGLFLSLTAWGLNQWESNITHATWSLYWAFCWAIEAHILWLLSPTWTLWFPNHNVYPAGKHSIRYSADSRYAPCQWETVLLCNDVSHWLGANLEWALMSLITWYHYTLWVPPLCSVGWECLWNFLSWSRNIFPIV